MKSINLSDYNLSLGPLIDVRPKYEYVIKPLKNATNIPYNELIFNHDKYLDKNKTYFIICEGGIKSKKAANVLSVYGYNVFNVIKDV